MYKVESSELNNNQDFTIVSKVVRLSEAGPIKKIQSDIEPGICIALYKLHKKADRNSLFICVISPVGSALPID